MKPTDINTNRGVNYQYSFPIFLSQESVYATEYVCVTIQLFILTTIRRY